MANEEEVSASVIIVPDHLSQKVREFAEQLAEEETDEVQGFAMGMNLASFAPMFGRTEQSFGPKGDFGGSSMGVIVATECRHVPSDKGFDLDCAD